ncbi:MAG: hypothetical protein ACKO7W_07985 [Elainella sp.]
MLLFPIALWRQQWRLLAGLCVPLSVFIAFYADFFLPSAPADSAFRPLTVMTFNMLWSNTDYNAIERLFGSTSPDLG